MKRLRIYVDTSVLGGCLDQDKIRLFNGVNLELGYKPLAIYSPREVATHGEQD